MTQLQITGLHGPIRTTGKTQRMAEKHIAGYRVDDDPYAPNGTRDWETFQCIHCAMHFDREPGKGPPAWCLRCSQPTCGQQKCDPCWPWEAKLLVMEGTLKVWAEMERQFNLTDSVF